MDSPNLISEPKAFDILLGRGHLYHNHPGNLRLHERVNIDRERYLKGRKCLKTAIADTIVRDLQVAGDNSGRFLKRLTKGSKEFWVEVSDIEAHEKVSHALRGRPRRVFAACQKSVLVPHGQAEIAPPPAITYMPSYTSSEDDENIIGKP